MTPRPISPHYVGETIANLKRMARAANYDPEPLVKRIKELLADRNLSARSAAIQAGLDHQAIRRLQKVDSRPDMTTCIMLADFFDVNPNEFLELAGWPTLKAFELRAATATVGPEAVAVAVSIANIQDPARRKRVAGALKALADMLAQDKPSISPNGS
jgi:transcriptional regulator with XRE-family HTH domain